MSTGGKARRVRSPQSRSPAIFRNGRPTTERLRSRCNRRLCQCHPEPAVAVERVLAVALATALSPQRRHAQKRSDLGYVFPIRSTIRGRGGAPSRTPSV